MEYAVLSDSDCYQPVRAYSVSAVTKSQQYGLAYRLRKKGYKIKTGLMCIEIPHGQHISPNTRKQLQRFAVAGWNLQIVIE